MIQITTFQDLEKLAKDGVNVVSIAAEIAADTLTPVAAYLRLSRADEASFLLESRNAGEGGSGPGRYSFVGVQPVATLIVTETEFRIQKNGKETVERGAPIQKLKSTLESYRSQQQKGLPPFQAGCVGYLAFDVIRHFETVPAVKDDSFLVPDACFTVYRNLVTFDHYMGRVFLISNLFLDETSLDDGYKSACEHLKIMAHTLLTTTSPREHYAPTFQAPPLETTGTLFGKEKFIEAVGRIKKHIRAGDIFQCVLSERFEVELGHDPFLVYRALRMTSPTPYLYFISQGRNEALLGASPEMLVKVTKGELETRPIAGTRPRGKTEEADKTNERNLLASVKERAEHLMLVDLGRNDLGRVSRTGSVEVRNFMHVERFSNVMHLVSNVHGVLNKQAKALDALFSCFPAGTLSGAPKIKAMEIIANLEKTRRGTYGGAVVYYDFSGDLDSCIAIRSLYAKNGRAFFQAGAGVVADSTASREYDEILHKSLAMRRALAIAKQQIIEPNGGPV